MNFDIILRGWIEAAYFFLLFSLWIGERKTEFLHKSSRSHTNREQVATAIMLIPFQRKISFQCNDWTVNMNTQHLLGVYEKKSLFRLMGCVLSLTQIQIQNQADWTERMQFFFAFFYCISRYFWRKSDVFFSIYLRFIRIMVASFFSTPFAFAIFFISFSNDLD